MADQVDSMSDAELRTKLAEHGFPVMPITASTRNLLVKKLKLVLDNKSKPRNSVDNKAESRKTLSRYSSGEESDLDTNNAKEKKGRRATTGGAMLPPVTARTRRGTPKKESSKVEEEKGSDSDEEKSPVQTHEEVETLTTRRVTRTYAVPKDTEDYDTGSDSDIDGDRKTTAPNRSSSRSSDYISSTLPTNDASTSPPKLSMFGRPSLSTSYSSSDHLNSIRSRLGLTSNLADRPSAASSYASSFVNNFRPSTSTDETESPYLSDFTRRLSALKPEQKPLSSLSLLDRGDNNGSVLLPRRSYITSAPRSSAVNYKTGIDKNFLKNNLVSLALVGTVILFFFCLFFIYVVKKNDITSVVDDRNSAIPICQLNIPGNLPGINCVPKDQVTYAKDLLKAIHPELVSRATAYKCGTPNSLPYLLERDILDIASSKVDAVDLTQCRTDLNNLQVLLVNNPSWGINVVQLKNPYSKDVDYLPLTSTEVVVRQRNKGTVGIALKDPSAPLSCLILNTLYSAGSTVIAIALLTAMVIGSHRIWKYYQRYQAEKNEEIYSMVEQIIDVISQETEGNGEPYISVDHVRDTLISPQSREKMSSIWDAAVKFIQKNESRVRLEVQSVDGEDCKVWRWISHGSPKRNTAWQGQAFETQEGSVNNLSISPTPCLKIRHMFEKDDSRPELQAVLTDAILEKSGAGCRVLHVAVERTSCCVYVRCGSAGDAGLVYRALHGWWYEGRLITVKYLRLERYLQRFPDAPHSPPYLQPSKLARN